MRNSAEEKDESASDELVLLLLMQVQVKHERKGEGGRDRILHADERLQTRVCTRARGSRVTIKYELKVSSTMVRSSEQES